MARKSRTNKN